jgi:hypothetical protein
VSDPKTINIKQYLNTNNFSVNSRHFVIKSSQATQLYITKVFYEQFSCHDYKKKIFVRNFDKINIFWFSSITRLKQDATRHVWYFIFSMTFNLKRSVHQEFSFIIKIKIKSFFVTNSNKINIFCFSSMTYKGSNTGKRARRIYLRHPKERVLVSNDAPSSWRPIEIFPVGVWDFSVLPSYRCLIIFLTNFSISYVFRCLILFITKHLCFVYIPSSVFLQNCFLLVKLIVDLSIYIRILAVF